MIFTHYIWGRAVQDNLSPLQRLQVIKGWYQDGELREQVLDVAGGDNGTRVDSEGLDGCCAVGHRAIIRERAIWQTPAKNA